ncbi:MAG: YdcH family protein [Paracoccaceae bacterium]
MSNTPHDLAEEFPGQSDKIHALKLADAHFAKLLEQYTEINRAVHRAETRVDSLSEEAEAALRRQRSHLKDHIAHHLAHGADSHT